MTFDDFLDRHQKLLKKMLESPHEDQLHIVEIKTFIKEINILIETYVDIEKDLEYKMKVYGRKANQLCKLRDQLTNLKANYGSSSVQSK